MQSSSAGVRVLSLSLLRLSYEGPSRGPKAGETGFDVFDKFLRKVTISIRASPPWRALLRQRRGIHPASKPSRQIQPFLSEHALII